MTPFLQRTVLILLGTSAICAGPSAAQADLFTPRYPTRLAAASPSLQPAVMRDDAEPQLILAARHKRSAAKGPPATVTVRKGDTLDAIANRLDVTVEQLKAANGLKRNTIQPGDVLKNPKAKAEAKASSSRKGAKTAAREEPAAAPETYKVARGDTIYSISKRFGVSMDALREANGLSRKAQIHAGQTLQLPGETEAADAQAAEEMARKSSRSGSRSGRAREEAPAETAEERSAAGRVITVEGRAASYTVRKGDSLAKIADKLNTTVDDLKADNNLKKSAIHPGQVLKGPRKSAKAYVAAPGDSLEDVAKRFGVSTKALRAENGLSRNARIRTGQKVRLPAGYRDHGPVRTYAPAPSETFRERPSEVPPTRITPPSQPLPSRPQPYTPTPSTPQPYTPTPSAPQPYTPTPSTPQPYTPTPSAPRPYTPTPSAPRPYTPPVTPPPAQPGAQPPLAPQAAPPVTDAQISALGRGRFVWPVRGEILSEFGPKAGGQRNDGLNVQAQAGDPVRAAAAGDVVYAGDQVPGFGNLVLIKHADGWVTAYGHLSRVEVKMQQRVTQGQQIGQAGSTGGVPEPQVHFEVRYAPSPLERARPIDPRLVLPR
jgi:murein DD-endopeptidase MepM/ murein hydrolase activator NlpD